jgi:hypothetical protein
LFHLVLESHDGRAPGADSEEKHEPVSDIDTVVVDSLKALDPEWPIREADMAGRFMSTCPSNLMILVRHSDLKFLNELAAIMIGTSNPPH